MAKKERKPVALSQKNECGLTVVVNNKQYLMPNKIVQFDQLLPDPKNPRYQYILEGKEEITAEEMYERLRNDEKTFGLVESISSQGGLTEPLIVEEAKGGFKVREGNRRWCALRMLRERQAANKEPVTWGKDVPVHIIPKG